MRAPAVSAATLGPSVPHSTRSSPTATAAVGSLAAAGTAVALLTLLLLVLLLLQNGLWPWALILVANTTRLL
jgi:hypothetical protein